MIDGAHAGEGALLVEALEGKELEAMLLDWGADRLAAVEGHLVAALAQRRGDAELRQQMAGERPQREQEAAAHRAVSADGAGSIACVRPSIRRMCPPKYSRSNRLCGMCRRRAITSDAPRPTT